MFKSKTRFYKIYRAMLTRCTNPRQPSWKLYGKRGIKVLWETFEDFAFDMLASYKRHIAKHGEMDTTIDRIDPNGHYEKNNCRWATKKQQASNMRCNRIVVYNGKRMILAEYARKIGINSSTALHRIANGIPLNTSKRALKGWHHTEKTKKLLSKMRRERAAHQG